MANYTLTREQFRELIRGEVVRLDAEVFVALADIGWDAMAGDVSEALVEGFFNANT